MFKIATHLFGGKRYNVNSPLKGHVLTLLSRLSCLSFLRCTTELTTILHQLDSFDANLNSLKRKLDSFDANLNSQKTQT